jgi:hypothetical protein
MVGLLNLPVGSVLLANELSRVRPPYYHGQLLLALRLDNGVLIEATWDDDARQCVAIASIGEARRKAVVGNRTVMNPQWLPGVVSTLAWSLDSGQREQVACRTS